MPVTAARRLSTSTVLCAGTVPPNVIGCSTGARFVLVSMSTAGGDVCTVKCQVCCVRAPGSRPSARTVSQCSPSGMDAPESVAVSPTWRTRSRMSWPSRIQSVRSSVPRDAETVKARPCFATAPIFASGAGPWVFRLGASSRMAAKTMPASASTTPTAMNTPRPGMGTCRPATSGRRGGRRARLLERLRGDLAGRKHTGGPEALAVEYRGAATVAAPRRPAPVGLVRLGVEWPRPGVDLARPARGASSRRSARCARSCARRARPSAARSRRSPAPARGRLPSARRSRPRCGAASAHSRSWASCCSSTARVCPDGASSCCKSAVSGRARAVPPAPTSPSDVASACRPPQRPASPPARAAAPRRAPPRRQDEGAHVGAGVDGLVCAGERVRPPRAAESALAGSPAASAAGRRARAAARPSPPAAGCPGRRGSGDSSSSPW